MILDTLLGKFLTGSIKDIKKLVATSDAQNLMATKIDAVRNQMNSSPKMLAVLKKAQANSNGPLGIPLFLEVLKRAEKFTSNMPGGHDPGHNARDVLAVVALAATDPTVKNAAFPVDVDAGIWAALLHDIANAVVHRYEDNKRKCGHGEVGAIIAYALLKDLYDEDFLTLVVYGIAAHTHYLEPVKVETPSSYTRKVYPYRNDDGPYKIDNQYYGMCVLLTRFADRLDTNGVTLLFRHLLANADSVESGADGKDLSGTEFYEINKDSLIQMWKPNISMNSAKQPSTLLHMQNFAASNFGRKVFSWDDFLFPKMWHLMMKKSLQSLDFIDTVVGHVEVTSASDKELWANLCSYMRTVSKAKNLDPIFVVLKPGWEQLTREEKLRWDQGFKFAWKAYIEWVLHLVNMVENSDHPLAEVASSLKAKCL